MRRYCSRVRIGRLNKLTQPLWDKTVVGSFESIDDKFNETAQDGVFPDRDLSVNPSQNEL